VVTERAAESPVRRRKVSEEKIGAAAAPEPGEIPLDGGGMSRRNWQGTEKKEG